MQRMHYVMHYVMHRVLAKMGWPSLDRVLSKMAEASLRSYSWGSYNTSFTVHGRFLRSGTIYRLVLFLSSRRQMPY